MIDFQSHVFIAFSSTFEQNRSKQETEGERSPDLHKSLIKISQVPTSLFLVLITTIKSS